MVSCEYDYDSVGSKTARFSVWTAKLLRISRISLSRTLRYLEIAPACGKMHVTRHGT